MKLRYISADHTDLDYIFEGKYTFFDCLVEEEGDLEKLQSMSGTLKIKPSLKTLVNGRELGIILKMVRVCTMQFKEKAKLLGTVQVF